MPLLFFLLASLSLRGQAPWPPLCIQGVEWNAGTHNTAVSQAIEAPCSTAAGLLVTDAANAELVSGMHVHLTDGFHAGSFNESGSFHAYTDEDLGQTADLVLISPDAATHIVDNVVHVEKWEKLEVGLRLPQEYLDAIDRFYAHYYANGIDTAVTVDSLDRQYDLNPYADDSLHLNLVLTSPSGQRIVKWGFFMTEAAWADSLPSARLVDDQNGVLSPYTVRFRLAPDEEGPWQFEVRIAAPFTQDPEGNPLASFHGTGYNFVCDPALPDNRGPLHVNQVNHRLLQFENGDPFFALGLNMADIGDSLLAINTMQQAMDELHSAGGNFLRMWLMRHQFAPEWVNLGVYDHYREEEPCTDWVGPPRYLGNCQHHCWAFDRILEHARKDNIYVQLCIDPNGPGIAYEVPAWGQNPYVRHFVEPVSDSRPYDVKEYFYQGGDAQNKGSGVFYYWKRRYKYIMARWGYSVNIASFEPFNETDQLLSYRTNHLESAPDDIYYTICPENRITWHADSLLPVVIDQWMTDITEFVRGPVDTLNISNSSLGEDDKLFIMSYTDAEQPSTALPNYFLPFHNPNVDMLDVHRYLYAGGPDLRYTFDMDSAFRSTFTVNEHKKPMNNGEIGTWGSVDDYRSYQYYSNYDVSFHNELWASAFFGNFGVASSWYWGRVFWWEQTLPPPPHETILQNPLQQFHTNSLGALNIIAPNSDSVGIVNKKIFHNFSPISRLIMNSDVVNYGIYNDTFDSKKVYDAAGEVEAYYIVSLTHPVAIGWVHNANAYWENSYYVKNISGLQNFFGCTAPPAGQIALTGLQPGIDYHITWFPTRMGEVPLPDNSVDTSRTGSVLLDMSTLLLGDTANNYLDTLRVDYAFVIAPQPIQRSMVQLGHDEGGDDGTQWDYGLYPNPARDVLVLIFPDNAPVTLELTDIMGQRVHTWVQVTGSKVSLALNSLPPGAYFLRASSHGHMRTKKLIIQ